MSKAAEYVDDFLSSMGTSGRGLYNRVIGTLRELPTADDRLTGGPQASAVLVDVAEIVDEFISSSAYQSRIENLLKTIPRLSTALVLDAKEKFGPEIPEELVEEVLAIGDTYQSQLEDAVDDQVVRYNIMSPFIDKAFILIGRGEHPDKMQDLADTLPDVFIHYYITKVTTILEQFEREVWLSVSEAYGVKRWRYVGPDDERNRDFCSSHVDKVYTAAQIEAWADQEWDGQIPGTDASTIWTNLGGYNCRHILEPL